MGLKDIVLNIHEVEYSSNLSLSNLKQRIEGIDDQKSLKFAGRLKNENEFSIYDKQSVIGWNNPNFRRKSAYLKGIFTPNEQEPLLRLMVKPNSFLPVFSITALLAGLTCSLVVLTSFREEVFPIVISLVFVGLGMIYYPIEHFVKKSASK